MNVQSTARLESALPPATPTRAPRRTGIFSRTVAAALVLPLLLPYSAYFWVSPSGAGATLLGFVPGVVGTSLLLAGGFGSGDLYLRLGRLSRAGALALAGVFPLLAVIVASGAWSGWDGPRAVESAMGGLAQELYFRASLLPALLWLLRGSVRRAIVGQALLDVTWHARMFTQSGLVLGAVIFLVLLVTKLAWAYAVHHDRTLAWVTLQHSAFLVAMSLFTWEY
jgi:Type II CAAX prenyl endopeptidase Rce1-like